MSLSDPSQRNATSRSISSKSRCYGTSHSETTTDAPDYTRALQYEANASQIQATGILRCPCFRTGSCFVTSIDKMQCRKAVHLQQGAALLFQLLFLCNWELFCYFNCCFVASGLSSQVESKKHPQKLQVESKTTPRSSKLSPKGALEAPS